MLPPVAIKDTVVGRLIAHLFGQESTPLTRVLLIVALAVTTQAVVKGLRRLSEWAILKSHTQKGRLGHASARPKVVTVARLAVSGVTFVIYFLALGFVLQEFRVSLTGYLASASIIGLAISFGSQGLIQDIVIGLTLIFWDAMEVGDMVEVFASTTIIGRVEEIGMRFTKIVNVYNQEVLVPNRTIANVSRFPQGGLDAYADVQVPAGADPRSAVELTGNLARGMWSQFEAIILSEPVIGQVETVPGGGWRFFRVHFKIWPGQGALIETTFRQQAVRSLQALFPAYAEWQIPVTYRAHAARKPAPPAGPLAAAR